MEQDRYNSLLPLLPCWTNDSLWNRVLHLHTSEFLLAPIQLHTILTETPQHLQNIRAIIVGGGVISEESEFLLKKHKLTVYQTFGMTETISHIAMRKVGFETEEQYTGLNHVTISSENDRLMIYSPKIGIDVLQTNDLIEIVEKNQFKWIGRADFVINSGGIKLQIEAIEKEMESCIQNAFLYTKDRIQNWVKKWFW